MLAALVWTSAEPHQTLTKIKPANQTTPKELLKARLDCSVFQKGSQDSPELQSVAGCHHHFGLSFPLISALHPLVIWCYINYSS